MENKIPATIKKDRDGETESHESYGMIGIHRQSCNKGMSLFGSSIKHHTIFSITIHEANKHRSLNRNWYGSKREIVEIHLSSTQLVDLITSPNIGDGIPCTIIHDQHKQIDGCPEVDQRQIFEDEFKRNIEKVIRKTESTIAKAQEMFAQDRIKKSDQTTVLESLRSILQDLQCNMPFVYEQFNEAMDKTVSEAKGEVEAFVTSKALSLGIEALQDEVRARLPEIETKRIEKSE